MADNLIDTAKSGKIRVIARAGEILRVLGASDRGVSLRFVAEATDLPRSTVHRIVVALAAENLVVWDPERGRAELGVGLVSLALRRRRRLRDIVRPYLEALSRRVDETVDLVTLRADKVVFIDQVIAHQLLVVSAVGAVLPVHCTACGKSLLAELPREEVIHLLPEKLERFTPHTLTSRSRLIDELATVRRTQVAFDREEHVLGVAALGAVFHNAWGEVASVTIPVPSTRFAGREAELSQALLETCDELNNVLTED